MRAFITDENQYYNTKVHILKFFETDDSGKTLDNNTIMVTKVEEMDGQDNYSSLKDKGDVKVNGTPNANKTLNESSIKDKTPDGNKDEDDKKFEDGEDPNNQSKSSCKLRFKIKAF